LHPGAEQDPGGRRAVAVRGEVVAVTRAGETHRLSGSWSGLEKANGFLAHLDARAFSPATVRAYAYDLVNFARFLIERGLPLEGVVPTDVFDWVDSQSVRRPGRDKVVSINGVTPTGSPGGPSLGWKEEP